MNFEQASQIAVTNGENTSIPEGVFAALSPNAEGPDSALTVRLPCDASDAAAIIGFAPHELRPNRFGRFGVLQTAGLALAETAGPISRRDLLTVSTEIGSRGHVRRAKAGEPVVAIALADTDGQTRIRVLIVARGILPGLPR